MIIELWAKRLDGRGHVLLNEQNVPDNLGDEYRVAVRPMASVGTAQDALSAPITLSNSMRIFMRQYDPLSHLLDGPSRYLEI